MLFHQIKSLAKVPNKYVPQKENLKHGLNLSKIQAELFNPATNLGVSHKNELHYMFHINNITPLSAYLSDLKMNNPLNNLRNVNFRSVFLKMVLVWRILAFH